ncbi:uncharacterized protein FMAN_02668 [Fusarium mangiferae]|uniref:Uncharacterized protein n=1 Tax=Fusarium mangiferae TaxID=192010 RepID=A0A1L7TN60_FUSMA|nr:uncharacterized protein FMAN_02668 [Fusarium mangiferae]CVL00014.1 uncharacterized protein FMAN_02668 [Fusarium mangiferae]
MDILGVTVERWDAIRDVFTAITQFGSHSEERLFTFLSQFVKVSVKGLFDSFVRLLTIILTRLLDRSPILTYELGFQLLAH